MKPSLRIATLFLYAAGLAAPGFVLIRHIVQYSSQHAAPALQLVSAGASRLRSTTQDSKSTAPADSARNTQNVALAPVNQLDRRLAKWLPALAQSSGPADDSRQSLPGQANATRDSSMATEIPRFRRWEIYMAHGITIPKYSRLLDELGIELGMIGPTEIQYAFHLTRPVPETRKGPVADEQRLYMSWRRGDLEDADRQLMSAAGCDVAGKVVVQFLPQALEDKLASLEHDFAGREEVAISKTRFGVRLGAAGYELYVLDQAPLH